MLKITRIAQSRPPGLHPDSPENMDWERDQMSDFQEDPQQVLIEAVRSMLEEEESASTRSEAVGETGMRERFAALRQAVDAVDPQGDPNRQSMEEWPDPQPEGSSFYGPSGTHGVDGYDDDFPYGR